MKILNNTTIALRYPELLELITVEETTPKYFEFNNSIFNWREDPYKNSYFSYDGFNKKSFQTILNELDYSDYNISIRHDIIIHPDCFNNENIFKYLLDMESKFISTSYIDYAKLYTNIFTGDN